MSLFYYLERKKCKQQRLDGEAAGSDSDLDFIQVRGQQLRATPWAGLQTQRGCYAKAVEHGPVLQLGLDKCDTSVD